MDRVEQAECERYLFPYLCAHQKSQRDPDTDLYSQFALRRELSSAVLIVKWREGGRRTAPTFGHRYRDISLMIPQSAFRCSWVVSSASASRGAFGLGFSGGFVAATAETAPFFPSAGVFRGPLCWSMDAVEAKPRAVRIRAESNDGQRRGALRAIGRKTQAESIWSLEFRRIYGGKKIHSAAHSEGGYRGIKAQ